MPWTPNRIAVNEQDLEAYRRIGDSKMTFLIFFRKPNVAYEKSSLILTACWCELNSWKVAKQEIKLMPIILRAFSSTNNHSSVSVQCLSPTVHRLTVPQTLSQSFNNLFLFDICWFFPATFFSIFFYSRFKLSYPFFYQFHNYGEKKNHFFISLHLVRFNWMVKRFLYSFNFYMNFIWNTTFSFVRSDTFQ